VAVDPITYDEFKKMELIVGKIISIENHPDADKLFVIQVDLGAETRQIVAGLRPYYTPERLLGRSVVIVANLAPAKLRGIFSNGMLLAAQDGANVVVLSPETDVAPGSRVS